MNQKPTRNRGVVQYWNEKKGYGLIENDDGRDVHVYKKDLDFLTLLDTGDEIEYEIKNSKHGLKAVHVKMIKDSLFSTRS
jgi:cold shock protein